MFVAFPAVRSLSMQPEMLEGSAWLLTRDGTGMSNHFSLLQDNLGISNNVTELWGRSSLLTAISMHRQKPYI
jgi:hypothetical protein